MFRIISVHTHTAEGYDLAQAMESHHEFHEELRGYADPDNELMIVQFQEIDDNGKVVYESSKTTSLQERIDELQAELDDVYKDAAGASL